MLLDASNEERYATIDLCLVAHQWPSVPREYKYLQLLRLSRRQYLTHDTNIERAKALSVNLEETCWVSNWSRGGRNNKALETVSGSIINYFYDLGTGISALAMGKYRTLPVTV